MKLELKLTLKEFKELVKLLDIKEEDMYDGTKDCNEVKEMKNNEKNL